MADDRPMAPRLAPVSEKKKTTSTWWMVEVDSRMVVLEQSQVHVTRYVLYSGTKKWLI